MAKANIEGVPETPIEFMESNRSAALEAMSRLALLENDVALLDQVNKDMDLAKSYESTVDGSFMSVRDALFAGIAYRNVVQAVDQLDQAA
jgi:hypothetical protein